MTTLMLTVMTVTSSLLGAVGMQSEDPIRIAIFDLQVTNKRIGDARAVTDYIAAKLAAVDEVELVNRTDLAKVVKENELVLIGSSAEQNALQGGKLVNADFILTGSVSQIGQSFYAIAKLIDVETTVQHVVSGEAGLEVGLETALERLAAKLTDKVTKLKKTPQVTDDRMESLKRSISRHRGKRVMVAVSERHVSRPLPDPAAATELASMLIELGFTVVDTPETLPEGWKDELQRTGLFNESKVDLLITGEGVSEFGARLEGLISCRARVELKLILVPGQTLTASEAAVASGVDLSEALAAKSAIQTAARKAAFLVLERLASGGR